MALHVHTQKEAIDGDDYFMFLLLSLVLFVLFVPIPLQSLTSPLPFPTLFPFLSYQLAFPLY